MSAVPPGWAGQRVLQVLWAMQVLQLLQVLQVLQSGMGEAHR